MYNDADMKNLQQQTPWIHYIHDFGGYKYIVKELARGFWKFRLVI